MNIDQVAYEEYLAKTAEHNFNLCEMCSHLIDPDAEDQTYCVYCIELMIENPAD